MSRRANQTSAARERERISNRERMAKKRLDTTYRDAVNAKRKARDRERKQVDPTLRPRLTATSKCYYDSRKRDPLFWSKRKEYLARWKAERRLDEAFEDFMARIENPVDIAFDTPETASPSSTRPTANQGDAQ